MPFDYFTVDAVVRELQRYVAGKRITRALLAAQYELVLEVDRVIPLLISASPHFGRILRSSELSLIKQGKEGFERQLVGAKIRGVERVGSDRIIRFDLVKRDWTGTEKNWSLFVELIGRNSNAVLIEGGTDKIVGTLRRVTRRMNRQRQIVPGAVYHPPPLPERLLPSESPFDPFEECIARSPEVSAEDMLTRLLLGLSALSAREICFRAGVPFGVRCAALDEGQVVALWEHARHLYKDPPPPGGAVILDEAGAPSDFTPLDLTHLPETRRHRFPSLCEAIERYYQVEIARWEERRLTRDMEAALTKSLVSLQRRAARLQQDMENVQKADLYQKKGHILLAYLHRVPAHAKGVELEDIYASDGRKIAIELDPKCSPVENAQRYLTQYRKAKSGEQVIKGRMDGTQRELKRIRVYQDRLTSAVGQDELKKLRASMVEEDLIQSHKKVRENKGEPRQAHPRRYVTSEGWNVLVGRNNAENDTLTHRMASKDDLWFHAQGCPGSHVVLRKEGRVGKPSRRTLEETAGLAAYWSKARGSKTVPVNYTEVKYVRKPKGGRPGLAVIEREKTLFVEPKLIKTEEEQSK